MFDKKRYVLVCTNERVLNHPKGSCAQCNSVEIRTMLKEELEKQNLKGKARILGTTCMDACEHGAVLCVMPDNVWYGGVGVQDVKEIVDLHLINGKVVERLQIPKSSSGLNLFG
mgnify:FL=1